MRIFNRVLHQTIIYPLILIVALVACLRASAEKPATTLTLELTQPGKAISPDLFGIFFEDINYSADGGLYAELVQNRSFEYSDRDNKDWNPLTAWELIQRDGGKGSVAVETNAPLNARNPHYAVLNVESAGAGLRQYRLRRHRGESGREIRSVAFRQSRFRNPRADHRTAGEQIRRAAGRDKIIQVESRLGQVHRHDQSERD